MSSCCGAGGSTGPENLVSKLDVDIKDSTFFLGKVARLFIDQLGV